MKKSKLAVTNLHEEKIAELAKFLKPFNEYLDCIIGHKVG
jgi:hypothetical protein